MYCFKSRKKGFSSYRIISDNLKHHKKPKKSQISVFIIIGLLIVIAASLFVYVLVAGKRAGVEKGAEEAFETGAVPPLSFYIQKCIDLESPPVIFKVAEQGGVLDPKEGSYLYYNKSKLNYLCTVEGARLEFACTNAFLTRQEMQRIISKEIKNGLRRCINLKAFEAQGYKVTAGSVTVRPRVGKKSVLVDVTYPINLTRENEVISVSEFNSEINLPLGELYELAMDIVNREIGQGYFDIDKWMVNNGANIIIEKHRPYPDKVYLLSEKISNEFYLFNKTAIKFQFAIQQNPSIAQRRPEQKPLYGLCRNSYDDICFENVQEAYCRQIDGTYNPSLEVSCIENFKQPLQKPELCDGHECKDCEYDFWGRKFNRAKRHGESWCVYDTITGKGYDYVGSRHHKHSCINGNVYAEECRDYREEFCTEDKSLEVPKAVCRVNRWYDCPLCTSDQCCNDIRYRDCFWNYETTIKQKCVPYVPPGLRFWENEGIDICLRANNEMDCEGISCPNIWIDDSARYCYQQADCGNYRNIADQVTYEGFFQTDPVDGVRKEIYLDKRWNRNPLEDGRYWSINLPLDTIEQAKLLKAESEQTPLGNIPMLLSSALQFIDEIVNIDISDFLNPFTPMPRIHIVDFAICSVWTAPVKKNYCVLCGADPAKPCSEYRCKSLGERCKFRMDEGIPVCELPSIVDKVPPVIEFNEDALTEGYEAKKAKLAGHSGVRIDPAIRPHRPFTFGLRTSEIARCRLKLSPRLPYFSLPSFWFNDPGFKEEHNLTIRMPPRLSVPQKLLDFLNITSTSEIITILEDLEPTYEYYKERLRDKLTLYTMVTGDDLIEMIDPQVRTVINFINGITPYLRTLFREMINQFERGGYYIFVECTDQAGNKNENEFFVQFEVDANYVDNEAPVIVHAVPQNNSKISKTESLIDLSLYVDEPAECRYSSEDREFDAMKKSFMCNTGYHISPVAGGTYECSEVLDRNAYNITFVRCKDNPSETVLFELSVLKSNSTGIKGFERYNYSNITPETYASVTSNSIEVPAKMMQGLIFKITQFPVDLKIYIAENMGCRYSNTTGNFVDMTGEFQRCRITNDIERGIYECSASIEEPALQEIILGNLTLKISRSNDYGVTGGYVSAGTDIHVEGGKILVSSTGKITGESSIDINTESMELELELGINTECRYSKNNGSFTKMDCNDGVNKTICSYSTNIGERSDIVLSCVEMQDPDESKYAIHIGCADINATEGNVNEESYVYVLSEAEPLDIIVKPEGVISEEETELIVKVSGSISQDKIICGYNNNPFYGMITMEKVAGDRFGVHLSDLEEGKKYRYYIQCYDDYGNEAEGYTEFEVIT